MHRTDSVEPGSSEHPTDRQLPEGQEVFLDHVGFFVRDLEDAGARLARLGFQISQVNLQTNVGEGGTLIASGTSNRLVRLRRGYLEVLAATHDTPLAAQFRQAIARYQGLHLIALSHDDIPGERARLTAAGFAMQPMVTLRRRDVTLPGAPEVAWSVLRPEPGIMVEGRVQFAKSHNPEQVWHALLTVHDNAADALTDILLCVADRHEAAARYSLYAGRPSVLAGDATVVPLDRGRIVIASAERVRRLIPGVQVPAIPFMAGQAVRSADLAKTRAVLENNGVTPIYVDDGLICVGASDALGATLLFHSAEVDEPWLELAARRPLDELADGQQDGSSGCVVVGAGRPNGAVVVNPDHDGFR